MLLKTITELKDVTAGEQICGKYLLYEKVLKKTKDGKDMYNMVLGDTTGMVDAVAWEGCIFEGDSQVGDIVGIVGKYSLYNDKPQVSITRLKKLDEDKADYVRSAENRDLLIDKFENMLANITDPYLSEVLSRIFTPEVKKEFYNAPGAKKIHHSYIGGLLEHTVQVANLCINNILTYPNLNEDLLVTGALLHDVGKIREFEFDVVSQYTAEGRMMGHIVMGYQMIATIIKNMREEGNDFPPELELMLLNMILSHHGLKEHGSPVVPMFPEAMMLHLMDKLDADINVSFNKCNEEGGEGEYFSSYDNFHGQYFFKFRY